MAIVTGLTAEAMQAIRDAVIVSSAVVGDNLMLTLHDGTIVNAGNVRGPQGIQGLTGNTGPSGNTVVTSGTRPGSPTDGQQIYETDTGKTLHWDDTRSLWLPDWSVAWGWVAGQKLTTSSPTYTISGNTDFFLDNVPVYDGRMYELGCLSRLLATGRWALDFQVDGVNISRGAVIEASPSLGGSTVVTTTPYQPNATGTKDFRMKLVEMNAGGIELIGSATEARMFWIKDIGPENAWSL